MTSTPATGPYGLHRSVYLCDFVCLCFSNRSDRQLAVNRYELNCNSPESMCTLFTTAQLFFCEKILMFFCAEKVIFHPNYSNVTHHNDIALIRLSRDIDFKPPNAKPICLPIGGFSKITSKKVNLLDFFL